MVVAHVDRLSEVCGQFLRLVLHLVARRQCKAYRMTNEFLLAAETVLTKPL